MAISPYIPSAQVIAPQASATSATGAKKDKQDAKLMDSCRQFEGQFFDMMLQEMRKTVPDDPTLGDDAHEQQIFQGMMDDNIAQEMAKHAGSNDLAAEMYAQLSAKRDAAAQAAPKSAETAAPAAALSNPNPAVQKNDLKLKKLPGNPDNSNDYDTAIEHQYTSFGSIAKR